jgi:hypothetical protein
VKLRRDLEAASDVAASYEKEKKEAEELNAETPISKSGGTAL